MSGPTEINRRLDDILTRVTDLSSRVDGQDSAIRQDLALIRKDVEYLKEATTQYITRTEFTPVQKAVYGTIGLLLVSIITFVLVQAGIEGI